MLALHVQITGKHAGKAAEKMQPGTAHAPPRIVTVADWLLTFEDSGIYRFDASAPDLVADEISQIPVASLLKDGNLLACPGKNSRKNRAGHPGTYDDNIYFLENGHNYHRAAG
jgi:hypothetical protein